MSFLLGTDVCIAFLTGSDPGIRDRLLSVPSEEVRLCGVVKAELLSGARKSGRVDVNLRRLDAFFEPFASLAFDDAAASWYGATRAMLEGRPLGSSDLMIAAIALATDSTLVTRKATGFRRVVGLKTVSWDD